MNLIHKLKCEVAELAAERSTLLQGMDDLRNYLNSPKFAAGRGDLAGYVNVKDVLARLEETKSAATIANGDAGTEYLRELQEKRELATRQAHHAALAQL